MVSQDSQAILLLCSYLGLPSGGVKPLNLREWNELASLIRDSALERPARILESSPDELSAALKIDDELSKRITGLLERGAALASELERLESLGIWAITRADDHYPEKYRQRLKSSAPPVLFGAGKTSLLGKPGVAIVGSRNASDVATDAAEFAGAGCAASKLVAYSGWMLTHDAFAYVIGEYGSTLVLVLALLAANRIRGEGKHRAYLAGGILVSIAAAAIQQSGIRLHPHFNHNDLMHVVQMGAVWLLYQGGRRLHDANRRA